MSNDERQRLKALRELNILDTPPSEEFDRITRMATKLFNLPLAAISLTDQDRQWFKSRVGTELTEVPRAKSPCSGVSASSEVVVIEDFLASDVYRDSPQAQLGMRFYAGVPLKTRDGYTLGTLCVLGPEPRTASTDEIDSLVDLSAMVMAQIELQHALGRIDPITRLPNRNQLAEDLLDLARDHPGVRHHAVFVELGSALELGNIIRVMGALHADRLACDGGHELRKLLGARCPVYSVGPCQYVYLSVAANDHQAREHALQLNRRLRDASRWRQFAIIVRPVIGITSFDPATTSADEVIRLALSACENARRHKTNVASYTEALDSAQQRRFRLLHDMHRALERGRRELHLVFQPRINLGTGSCVGAEALLRWTHPTLGDVSPSEFIPLIENTPLAKPLTRWVLGAAIDQAAQWFREGMTLRISANAMACNFEEKTFTSDLINLLQRFGLPPHAFEIELTESALMSHKHLVRKQLRMISNRGIRLAIDDFGTGYSSLAYLMNVPADIIKIDRVFTSTNRPERVEPQHTMLKALIELSHTMGFETVAEGFEPAAMETTLKKLGCDEAQSFAISKPLSPEAFRVWYGERGPGVTLTSLP